MNSNSQQKLESIANIAIVVVAVLLSYFLIQKVFFQPNSQQTSTEINKEPKISLQQEDWQSNRKTLILALQKGCHFCSDE